MFAVDNTTPECALQFQEDDASEFLLDEYAQTTEESRNISQRKTHQHP